MKTYDSDYQVRLATLEALGGDVTKEYNSVYEIDLEILRLTEEGGGVIDDTITSTDKTWSSQKISDEITQAIVPSSEKEVISVLAYANEAPETPSEGDYYIDSESNKLYKYVDSEWVEQTVTTDEIFITQDTGKLYAYINDEFTDVTGEEVDNTIYTTNTTFTNDLKPYKTEGIYTVVMVKSTGKEVFNMYVNKPNSNKIQQRLVNAYEIYSRLYTISTETWEVGWKNDRYIFVVGQVEDGNLVEFEIDSNGTPTVVDSEYQTSDFQPKIPLVRAACDMHFVHSGSEWVWDYTDNIRLIGMEAEELPGMDNARVQMDVQLYVDGVQNDMWRCTGYLARQQYFDGGSVYNTRSILYVNFFWGKATHLSFVYDSETEDFWADDFEG